MMPILLGGLNREARWHPSHLISSHRHQAMTKSLEVITEAVNNPKPPFRKVDSQPKKPQKHRYERRKIKAYLHLGEWMSGESTVRGEATAM